MSQDSPAAVLVDAAGNFISVLNGAVVPSPFPGIPLVGSDGMNIRVLATDAAGRPTVDVARWLGSSAPTIGQKTMANSIPVTLASDQTAVPVSISNPATSTPYLVWGDVTPGGTNAVPIRRTTYTEQTANFQGSIVSSSAADSAAGAGARTVEIIYHDATGAGEFSEIIALNGTTNVNLVNLNHCFIERMIVRTVGTKYGANTGTITLRTGLAGGGTIVGTIGARDGQTYWCHHYVSAGKTARVKTLTVGTKTNNGGSYWLSQGNPLSATTPDTQISPTFRTAQNTPVAQYVYTVELTATGFTRLLMYLQSDSSASQNAFYSSIGLTEE